MSWNCPCETFSQMVTRLQEVHANWTRKMCVLAARYYGGIDSIDQIEQRTFGIPGVVLTDSLEYDQAEEIINMR